MKFGATYWANYKKILQIILHFNRGNIYGVFVHEWGGEEAYFLTPHFGLGALAPLAPNFLSYANALFPPGLFIIHRISRAFGEGRGPNSCALFQNVIIVDGFCYESTHFKVRQGEGLKRAYFCKLMKKLDYPIGPACWTCGVSVATLYTISAIP